jgi:hypothetical protein
MQNSPNSPTSRPAGAKASGKVFISYRREDSSTIAGRIHDWLVQRMPPGNLFFDIDSIQYGVDFEHRIQQTIPQCRAVLAIIGPHWFTEDGRPSQHVLSELELARSVGVQIIPILVEGASMPPDERLPQSLQGFQKLNAAQVRSGRDFKPDMEELAKALGVRVSSPGRPLGTRIGQLAMTIGAVVALLAVGVGVLGGLSGEGPLAGVFGTLPNPTATPTDIPGTATSIPTPTQTPNPCIAFSDNFSSRDASWELSSTPDISYNTSAHQVTFVVPAHADFSNPNFQGPHMWRKAQGAFSIDVNVAQLLLGDTNGQFYASVGLIIWENSTSYVRLEEVAAETAGSSQVKSGIEFDVYKGGSANRIVRYDQSPMPGNTLRLSLKNGVITAEEYDSTSNRWSNLGTSASFVTTQPLVGFLATNSGPAATNSNAAIFKDFHLSCL